MGKDLETGNIEVVILTGMSGAGKSKVVTYLEDMGFFCIDNLPPQHLINIINSFASLKKRSMKTEITRLAFVVDIRSADLFGGMSSTLAELDLSGQKYRLIFLDASDEMLLSRYKQTRRVHPLSDGIGLMEAIRLERKALETLRSQATDIIDTTNFSLSDLRDYIYKLLSDTRIDERMTVIVESFGFKYGIPVDCDLIQDVRFIPNPYYDPKLRVLTGLDEDVITNVFSHEVTQKYIEKTIDLYSLIFPYYVNEGKVRLTVGVGCTGGRHRSVAIAQELGTRIKFLGFNTKVLHRDIDNDPRNVTKLEAYWREKTGDN